MKLKINNDNNNKGKLSLPFNEKEYLKRKINIFIEEKK